MSNGNEQLAQNLRTLLGAIEDGETHIIMNSIKYQISDLGRSPSQVMAVTRVPKPTPKIRVGDRIINAPMQEGPKAGTRYWVVNGINDVDHEVWSGDSVDHQLLVAHNCWHTHADAQAYAEASLAQRSTLVEGGEV